MQIAGVCEEQINKSSVLDVMPAVDVLLMVAPLTFRPVVRLLYSCHPETLEQNYALRCELLLLTSHDCSLIV